MIKIATKTFLSYFKPNAPKLRSLPALSFYIVSEHIYWFKINIFFYYCASV